MKKNSKWTGTKGVFQFTYLQAMKSKAMIITTAIFCLVALLSLPLMTIFSGDGIEEIEVSDIENIYIYEENISISSVVIDCLSKEKAFANIKFTTVDKEKAEDIKENVLPNESNNDVILNILCVKDVESEDYGITYEIYYSEESGISKGTAEEVTTFLAQNSDIIKYINAGIDETMAEILSRGVTYNTYLLDENGNIISDGISEAQYNINYALLMICLLAITFAASYVAGQIVTEKSSKIVEYLLTSIKPMAIITGKVFASVAIIFTELIVTLVSFILSGVINGILFSESGKGFVMPEILVNLVDGEIMAGASFGAILVALAVFIVGFTFYCFLGGVSGAMVSKVEELAEGTKLITFATIIGAYLALGLIMSSSISGEGWGSLNYLVYFLPLSAPFIVPSYMLFGIISVEIGLAVLVVNIVCTIALVYLVSTIYEQLIYHNGNPLKLKDLFHLSKNKVKKND